MASGRGGGGGHGTLSAFTALSSELVLEILQLLDDAAIQANIAGISSVFSKFLTFGDGPTDALLVNNDDWLSSLASLDFLREYGRHFTINRMLSFGSVKQRLARESPFSFLEFNYMILQARACAGACTRACA